MALKGTTRIELTNVKTGKTEVIEKGNLVTNAVPEILTLNPFGTMFRKADVAISGNTSGSFQDNFLPLCPNLFGGILLYEDQLEEDPAKYFASMDNKLVGYSSNDVSPADDPKRGSMNQSESGPLEDGTGYRFVFDFATSQANGVISSLGLTSKMGGVGGHSSSQDAYKNNAVSIERMPSGPQGSWGRKTMRQNNIVSLDVEKGEAIYAYVSSYNQITIGRVKFPMNTLGLCFGYDTWLEQVPYSETILYTGQFATVLEKYGQKFYGTLIDGGDGYIWGFQHEGNLQGNSSGKATVLWVKINKEDFTFTEGTLTLDAQLNYFGAYSTFAETNSYAGYCQNCTIIKDGVLYAIKYTSNEYMYGVYAIPLENPTNITLLKFDGNVGWRYKYQDTAEIGNTLVNDIGGVIVYLHAHIMGGKLIGGSGASNSNTNRYYLGCLRGSGKPGIAFGPFIFGISTSNSYWPNTDIYIQSCYLATINNLPTAVQKTADKTMKITYILREEYDAAEPDEE